MPRFDSSLMFVPLNGEIIDSPIGWVAYHIQRYVATNGEDGHIWRGVPCRVQGRTPHAPVVVHQYSRHVGGDFTGCG